MRIIVVDNDMQFTNSFSQRCKKAGVFCQVFQQPGSALAEIKKEPDKIDIVLISKEQGGGQDGLATAQAIRKDPNTADVPYVIMSSVWGKADFAKHQKTEFGANAYYSKKSPLTELETTIEAVTGFKFVASTGQTKMTQQTASTSGLNVQLHAANDVVNVSEEVPGGISMEAPINLFPDGAPPAPPATPQAAAPVIPSTPAPAAPAPKSDSTNSVQVTMPTMTGQSKKIPDVQAAAPAPSIEITLSSGAPGAAAVEAPPPAPAAPSAPVVAKPEGGSGGIDLGAISTDFQVESTSKPKTDAPAPAAPAGGAIEISLSASNQAPAAEIPVAANIEIPASADSAVSAPSITAASAGTAPEIPSAASPVAPPVSEEEAAKDLPYLFAGPSAGLAGAGTSVGTTMTRGGMSLPSSSGVAALSHPHVDVNTGGPLSNDVETLKKYLTMREQDVSVLTAQLTYAKEELGKSEDTIKRLTLENEDLFHQINDLKKRVAEQDQELQHAGKSMEGEVEQLRFEVKSKIDRIKFLDDRLADSAQQYEKLKERVRLDIRKIRVREKELESKLEILKKDSETLIAARENKILELKRKIDLLEFNYDTLQDKNELEKQNVVKANEKIDRVLKVIKLAMGVIEAEGENVTGAGPGADPADRNDKGVKAA